MSVKHDDSESGTGLLTGAGPVSADEHQAPTGGPELPGKDEIIVTDRLSRRRFFRQGSAFILGGTALAGTLASSSEALAADCDRGGSAEGKKAEHAGNGSDSDTGAGADPVGCGRRYQDKPKISRRIQTVDKIKA